MAGFQTRFVSFARRKLLQFLQNYISNAKIKKLSFNNLRPDIWGEMEDRFSSPLSNTRFPKAFCIICHEKIKLYLLLKRTEVEN